MSLLFRWVDSKDIVDHIFFNFTIVMLELGQALDVGVERIRKGNLQPVQLAKNTSWMKI